MLFYIENMTEFQLQKDYLGGIDGTRNSGVVALQPLTESGLVSLRTREGMTARFLMVVDEASRLFKKW